jgi:CheY-like chemotaxis protein
MSTALVLGKQHGPPEPDPHGQGNDVPQESTTRLTVLVVDDEQLIADTLAEILNESGYFSATPIYDSAEALELARRDSPDVLIADVVMPGINGIELAKDIRSACPKTRIVLLSGQALARDLVKEAGNEGYPFELWAKPIHPDVLLERLKGKRN